MSAGPRSGPSSEHQAPNRSGELDAKVARRHGDSAAQEVSVKTPSPTRPVSVSTFSNPMLAALAPPLPSLTDRAAFWLRRDIVRGVFLPGERLKVEHLANFYRIGRSPVQAGILMLVPSGLVTHEHQKGHRVAPVSLADYDDLRRVYRDLYFSALRKAVTQGDQAWEERVIVTLHRTSRIAKVLDTSSEGRELWQLAYKRLHSEILSGCGSPLMMSIIADLGNRLERYVNLFGNLETDRARDHHQEHRALVDVLLQRQPDRVLAEFGQYFERAQPMRDTIVEALQHINEKPTRKRRAADNTTAKAQRRQRASGKRPSQSQSQSRSRRH